MPLSNFHGTVLFRTVNFSQAHLGSKQRKVPGHLLIPAEVGADG